MNTSHSPASVTMLLLESRTSPAWNSGTVGRCLVLLRPALAYSWGRSLLPRVRMPTHRTSRIVSRPRGCVCIVCCNAPAREFPPTLADSARPQALPVTLLLSRRKDYACTPAEGSRMHPKGYSQYRYIKGRSGGVGWMSR